MVVVMLLFVLSFSLFIVTKQGVPERFGQSVDPQRSERQKECFENFSGNQVVFCEVEKEMGEPNYISIGDSHNLSFLPFFERYSQFKKQNGLFAGVGGCLPFVGVEKVGTPNDQERCSSMVTQLDELLTKNDIDTFFTVARWTYYTKKSHFGTGGFAPFVSATRNEISIENSRILFKEQYRETVERLEGYGVKVVVIAQVPHQYYWPDDISTRSQLYGIEPSKFGVERLKHVKFQQETNYVLSSINSIKFVDPTDTLCQEICLPFIEQIPLYYDDDHLSLEGIEFILPYLMKAIDTE